MDFETLKVLYDYPVHLCPRCGNRSLALKDSAPRASFQCFECEARFHGTAPYPAGAPGGRLILETSRERAEKGFTVDLSDRILASELNPEEYTEARLRRRHVRERGLRLGCWTLLLAVLLFFLVLLIQFIAGAL
jgi:hypothetical protein